jgi:hypothetical protein
MVEDDGKWVDPRGPDGVTILAPFEQARPNEHPGVLGGDPGKAGSLFDLDADPAEARDVAAENPQEVERLRALYRELQRELTGS